MCSCPTGGIGLIPPEFLHLKSTLPEESRHESKENTIWMAKERSRSLSAESAEQLPSRFPELLADVSRNLTPAGFLSAFANIGDPPIAYLGFLPQFDSSSLNATDTRLQGPLKECWALTLY